MMFFHTYLCDYVASPSCGSIDEEVAQRYYEEHQSVEVTL